ncbi:MAG: fumarate hydratase [Candidatus Omnitrophica bacterium]|nr:fumarate hydratase [Candidatus Omnitrophota bacterium]
MNLKKLKKQVQELTAKANFSLGSDVSGLLAKAYRLEKNKRAKNALKQIIDNADIAKKERVAICQDTGLPLIFIEAGKKITISNDLVEAIKQGVEDGYRKNFLRRSIVDPLKRGRSSYRGAIVHLDFTPKVSGLKITVFPKGFGSENKTRLKMFDPTADFTEIEQFIVESVQLAGAQACPPFLVGVGIGGTSDTALLLAKKALIEKANILNSTEKKILKKINMLKIGPMGLGGPTTCLSVKIRTQDTHIAGLPVGVNISCHALRRATLQIL